MSLQPKNEDFTKEDEENFKKNGLRQYGIYSAVVFQMLATMGLAFWGGKKINDYFEIECIKSVAIRINDLPKFSPAISSLCLIITD